MYFTNALAEEGCVRHKGANIKGTHQHKLQQNKIDTSVYIKKAMGKRPNSANIIAHIAN
jgi:hypothetical protein